MIENVLTESQVVENMKQFKELIKSITREGATIDKLLDKLEHSDFYTAPASTKYHGAYPGGLVDHSLCVYYNLKSLVDNKHLNDIISEDSIKIVALLHDLDKMNKYTTYMRNVPPSETCPSWTKEENYKTKDASELFVYGNHEQNSEFMARQFIPLTVEESTAILHHMGSMAWDSAKDNIGVVYNKYPLAMLLYVSDMISTYIEKA